MKQTKR